MLEKNKYICTFGEVLWDDFPSGRLPGGAPMNVAISLQNLGLNATMISRVGDDNLGSEIKDFMSSQNCSTQWIQIDKDQGTGIVKVHTTTTGENSYEIVQPIAWDFIESSAETMDLVQNAYATVYGTLVCRDIVSKETLLNLLEKAALKVYDVNFRPPFYAQTLVETLLLNADIVKMNDEELAIISSWYGLETANEKAQMQALKSQFDLQTLIVTKGSKGAILLEKTNFYTSEGYKVTVKNTVGSGDAFLAGYLKNRYEGNSAETALNFACALGALVATHTGANPVISQEDINLILKQ